MPFAGIGRTSIPLLINLLRGIPIVRLTQSLALLLATAMTGACSTSSPTEAELNAAQTDDEYWQKRYEQQCIGSGIQPGTPMLVKCVQDLMDIRAEQPDG